MKKYIILSFLLLMTTYFVDAQTRKYQTYTVKKGETLRSIARDFNVSTRDLFDLNPDVDRRPEENAVILIPIEIVEKSLETVSYTVKPKETLYSISKRFQITVEEIIKLNPILEQGLKDGQLILLPNTNVVVDQTEKLLENGHQKIIHIIEKGDTFYNVTRRYQITQEALIAQNPILKEGFKLGMELQITTDKKQESLVIPSNNSIKKLENLTFKSGKTLNVVLMMPFKLNEIDDVGVHFNNSTSLLNIATEFYQGVLVAVDSLKNQGAKINIQSFDSEHNDERIISILRSNNLVNTDVYIGPLFLSSAHKLAKNISQGFVIAPMNSKDHNKFSEANLIKSGVKSELLEERILQFMKRKYTGQNVIVVGDNKGTTNEVDRIAWKLKSNGIITNVKVLKPVNGYITKERFESVLNTNKQNWILLVGDDNIVFTDAVNTYGIADKSIDIRLFTLKNEGPIENANNVNLARLQYTYPSAEYSDFSNINTQSFVKLYKEKYLAPPSSNAIRGFDVTYDTLFRMLLKGTSVDSIDNYPSDRIAARFDYKPTSTSGFENNGIFILKIEPDLSLTLIE